MWGPGGLLRGGGGREGVPWLGPRGKPRRGAAAFCLGLIMVTSIAAMHGAGVSRSLLTLFTFWSKNPCVVKSSYGLGAETPQAPERGRKRSGLSSLVAINLCSHLLRREENAAVRAS